MEFRRFALAMVGHFLASLLYVMRRLHILNAVVDTSSILEHREELRELWEKRMMADDNQSSPSSTSAAEKITSKPSTEEGHEEEVVTSKTISESETQPEHKLTNGVANAIENNAEEEKDNANHIQEEASAPTTVESPTITPEKATETDHDNNNSPDSLEGDNVEEYVEEKTYTSELETSLVMKQCTETTTETVIETTTSEVEKVSEEKMKTEEPVPQEIEATSSVEEVDGKKAEVVPETTSSPAVSEPTAVAPEPTSISVVPEEHASLTKKEVSVKEPESHSSESVIEHIEITTGSSKVEETHQETEIITPVVDEKPILEIEESNQDGDGFVRLEECLPKVESTEEVKSIEGSSEQDTTNAEQKTTITNGHPEPSENIPAASTLSPTPEDKASNPEIEQFVKSGGVKRIIPGVQKTEQPYSTCTTETKIAMEIREMREREEELRLMREQAVLSPAASPVPPKSPSARSPSPSVKDGASPTPTGCGYRVSSVFGHKGTTSPSPPVLAEEEKKQFRGLNKESAVEREIRLARDREEELRKQKGLPPREDDSYVKPSQVKSSQVRVFGKMAGASTAVKQAATAKIQLEIEEQTQREMALRETGSIQTISHERTDAKVAKLKTPDTTSPPITNGTNGNHPVSNGNYLNGNGRSSPDVAPYKRGSPSPTGPRPANIFSQSNGKGNINMHKFISSKGKETTFSAPRNGVPFVPKEETVTRTTVTAPVLKLKRNVSVESKIQQEILEMKQREDELKLLHLNKANGNTDIDDNMDHEMNQKNNLMEYENGHDLNEEDISPRHNKLIAQWEQRIQKAES